MRLYKKTREYFLNPNAAMVDGLIAVDDHMDVDHLLEAYSFGIFPWPQEDLPTLWFSPPERGILQFKNYRPSRKLQKFLRKKPFEISMDRAFKKVITQCQRVPRPDQEGTWITDKILEGYLEFHEAGYAHSIEAWEDGELVGGLYGVYVAGVFCGESMFHKKDNASKACLHYLVEFLQRQGMEWMDIQMVTPHLESVGAEYITRKQFLKKLEESKKTAAAVMFDFELSSGP